MNVSQSVSSAKVIPIQTMMSWGKVDFGRKCKTMRIVWHDNTSTEPRYDKMVLSWTDANSGAQMSVTMSGKKVRQMWDGTTTDLEEFRNMTIHPKRGVLYLKWQSDGSGQEDKKFWGWQMTVTKVPDLKATPMTFAGVTYGGGRDREYKYGDAPPSDIPALRNIGSCDLCRAHRTRKNNSINKMEKN